jgi:PAS domain S-box-containing protein
MSEAMNMDRRREIRVPLQLPVECGGLDDGTYLSFSHDMSPNGLSLGNNGPFHVGSPCRLLFALPNRHEKAEVTGSVRWHTGQGAGSRVGIQFSEPIDFSVPFRAADQAVRSLQKCMDAHLGCLHQALGDAWAWINSEGEIVKYDDRFLNLLGYSNEEVQGLLFSEFVHVDDRRRLSNLLTETQRSGVSSSAPELFRMRSKDEQPIFGRIRVAPTQPWSTSRGIYIEDMTESCVLKGRKHDLEQMVGALQRAVAGRVIHLNNDLRIVDIHDDETPGRAHKQAGFFHGMDLRQATGLVETRVNGRKLWEQLEVCVGTGQEFATDHCHYDGRSDKRPDLFSPGTFNIIIKPIANLDDCVTSLLMVVKSGEPLGAYPEKKKEKLDHLEHILQAAARGFILKDLLRETCDPLTCLLARLDLLRHKVTLEKKKSQAADTHEISYYVEAIQEAEELVERLSAQFKYTLENTCYFQSSGVCPFDVNQTLAKTVAVLERCGGLDGCSVSLKRPSVMPIMEACEQEFVMMFLIFLLLSRTCLKNVSNRAISCETAANKKHVIAKISHNGFIHQPKYLDIIFQSDPLENYFFKSNSVCCMDTLLYHANLLLKKNKIKTKITNIPGQVSLSLVMPCRPPLNLMGKA